MRRVLVALVLALFWVPAVQAEEALRVTRVEAEAATLVSDDAALLHLRGSEPEAVVAALRITGSHIEVQVFEAESVRAASTGALGADDHLVKTPDPDAGDPTVSSRTDETLVLDDFAMDHVLNVYSHVPFHVEGRTGPVALESIRDALLRREGITKGGATSQTFADGPWFGSHLASGEHVMASTQEGQVRLHVSGDFVLEMDEVDLVASDGTLVRSTDDRTGYTGTAVVDEQAHKATTRFVRILVTGGDLDVTLGTTGSVAAWVQTSAAVDSEGPVHLVDAFGSLGGTAFDAPQSELPGPVRIVATPMGGQLALAAADPEPADARIVAVPQEMALILVVGSLALVSLALTVLMALRLWRRTPPLDEVEEALERRDYRRAAALAAKIHRRRPQLREAMLSRAVALSKMGDLRRVVREVESYLAHEGSSSTDGALHYVLGLAYMDLGREQQARTCLTQAARLTPDLMPDVSARLATPVAGGNAYA